MTPFDSHPTTATLETPTHDVHGRHVTRAAIFCTDDYERFGHLAQQQAIWLVPIAGRPMLDRVLGQLADLGIKSADLFVSQHAQETYRYVTAGDTAKNHPKKRRENSDTLATSKQGSRWGIDIKIIDVTGTHEGLRRLVYRELDEPILIGIATAMPPLTRHFSEGSPSSLDQDETPNTTLHNKREIRVSHPVLFCDTLPESTAAWMIARPEAFVGQHCRSLAKLASTLETSDEVEIIEEVWPLSIDSIRSLLHTQRLLLEEAIPGQPLEASRVEEGLWIGRNVDLHPSVRLVPPVYIGADCRIERGAILGPNAVVENHCIVGERTHITNSFVFPNTFVSHELSLTSALAGACFMQPLDAPQPIEGIDPFLLGPNYRVIPRFFTSRLLARVAGTIVLAGLFLPTLMLWCLGRLCGIRRPIRTKEAVRLPAYGPSNLWRTFPYREFRRLTRGGAGARFFTGLLRLLRAHRWPALPSVVSGKVAWVGLRPRSIASLQSLPEDRRTLCMKSKIGLVRLAELDAARHGRWSGDQEHASEIFYVATASPWFDLRLFWRSIRSPWF